MFKNLIIDSIISMIGEVNEKSMDIVFCFNVFWI